nr:unnamed protein product [Digitaria exilis]
MKWSTLLSKVVFAAGQQQERQQPPPPPPPPGSPLHRQQADQDLATPRLSSASAGGDEGGFDAAAGSSPSAAASPARFTVALAILRLQRLNLDFAFFISNIDQECGVFCFKGKHELESDFRRFWEEFRSSSSEKEKEKALNLAVDVFCRLVKQHSSVAQLVAKLVEAHVFSFVIGRAFVTDVEKLRIHSKGRSLHAADVIAFFSDITELGICPGSNLLYAVEVLVTEVSGTNDKQPLLDSGILCCLIYILNSLLSPNEYPPSTSPVRQAGPKIEKSKNLDHTQSRRLEIEGSVIHIMKALASHQSAAPSLIEDDALQVLFHMVANGSLSVFSQFRDGIVPLHTIQLHRHAMQVLGLLLANDNGTSAKYIRKHQLIKVLLVAVKDFDPQSGDAAYTMGIVDLLLECVELSYRPDNLEVQAEVLNRMFKIFSSHLENYKLCQQLRTVPLFILNMGSFPAALQELLSFDQQYKKVLREVGVLGAHPEEIGSLIEILKSGMVSTSSGSQFKLDNDAKCDTFGALWRILGANSSAQRIFGEATGFSLLLTTLHSFQNDSENEETESSLHTHMKIFGFLLRAMTAAVCNNSVNRIKLHTILSSNTFYDLVSESGLLCVDCEKQVILLLLELALEIVVPPTSNLQVECISSETSDDESSFLSATSFGLSRIDRERVYNASAVVVLIRSLLVFTPKVQLELLRFIEKLANAGPFNQENLTSVGCVGLLLETISPFLEGSSPILNHALRIVEQLGAYRLSSSELRLLVRYILQLKVKRSGHLFVNMMDKLIQMEDVRQGNVSLAPFIEMDMSKAGHASIQVSLGERTWPPVSGYSFVCWFQFQNFFKCQAKEAEKTSKGAYSKRSGHVLRIFSVGAVDDANTLFAELYLHDNGVFTISTGSSSSLSFPGIEMEEGKWHHLAVVHSKPNALAGLFQASVASLYLDGKLRHTGKLGYSPSPFGKSLQVTLGTPTIRGKVSDLSWRLRCCYLFEEVLTPGSICFMYILGQGYRGLFQDTDLLRFVPNWACGGEVMAILDSLEVEVPASSSSQRADSSMKQANSRLESSGIVWDMERLRNLSLQLSGRKLIFAFDGTSSDAFRASGTLSLLNLVDPTSAAASPIGGIPRYGRLSGDVYICNQCTIGDTVQTVGGMPVVLALVEAAETRDMLHMALELLALSLQQSHQNSLDIFFRIAACEASFPEPQKSKINRTASYASGMSPDASLDDLTLPKFGDDVSSGGSHGDLDDFSAQKDSFSHLSELENADLAGETSEFIVLSNADMVEHVLLDWTIWVAAPISVQITLLGFLERMVSMHWFRNHNLTILRRINLVQHLLVTLQRGDVEIPVLEKLVVLLGVILEDGFLASELELVVRFIIMTFDPPELTPNRQIVREAMGKHVIVRNMLLEMLIDLQNNNLSHLNGTLVADLDEATSDMGGDLQGEALMHKTYAARLMSGEAAAPAVATSILRSDCALRMAKDLTTTATDEKNVHDDDNGSSKDTFSTLPQDQEQSAKTMSITSFPQEQKSSSSESTGMTNSFETAEVKADDSSIQEPNTKILNGEANQMVNNANDQGRITAPSSNGIAESHQATDSPSSVSMNNVGSPVLSERSTHRAASTPSASPMAPFTSWPGSAGSYSDGRHLTASPSMASSISGIDLDSSPDPKAHIQSSPAVNTLFPISSKLLLDIDDLGYGGGPCSAGATAVLDFVAQILADIISEQIKAALFIESVLESVPLFVDIDSALVFQGLCLSRLMNFLERKLLLDDEEDGKKLDKSRCDLGSDAVKIANKEDGDFLMTSGSDTMSGLNLLTYDTEQKDLDAAEFASFKDDDDIFKGGSTISAPIGWTDDKSSINEQSLHSATEFGAKSSSLSFHMTESQHGKSELSSPRRTPSVKGTDAKTSEDKSEKELLDNGEYLIRPYLEPYEKIRHKYNCERVAGLDKHDGIFLIGELCLYIIENFYIDDSNCICEKGSEDELSVIDQALGVNKDIMGSSESQLKSPSTWGATTKVLLGGRAWAYNGGAWGKEKLCSSSNLPHPWHMWKLDSVHELLKRDYQLRPVAIEIFSMDGCNELLVFHKKEREEVFKNLIAMNLPRNSMLDTTISASSKQDSGEGSRLFKVMAKSFSKRWQSGEITNFQYLMHLNTLAGRGYSDLTQYPVFPWVLADYESDTLDLRNPQTFRKLDKPMGCQTEEGEEEFRKRLPPFSTENQKLQGGQFDHADRLFNSVKDTWFNLDLGEKQSGEKVGDVVLPPWAKGSVREFIRKHREALESDYVSENLHHWIDLIFGYKQRGKAAEDAVNVFYHYTYEGNVDIDAVSDPTMKASILAQINHFGQTPKQLFQKPHPQRRTDRKVPPHPLRYSAYLTQQEICKTASSVSQIVSYNDKILIAAANSLLKPVTYSEYISWGFPDRTLRILTYDQDRLLSTHENLHGGSQIQCTGVSHDGNILTTGSDDGVVAVWRFVKDGVRRLLRMEKALCAHTGKITCVYVSQPYSLIVSGSDDCSVILWDMTSLVFVKQLPRFPASVSALNVNNLTGEILTGAGILFAVWSVNGDCLAVVNTSQLPSDLILSVASTTHSDWQDTNWYVTGHQSGAVKVWKMVHCSSEEAVNSKSKSPAVTSGGLSLNGQTPEYRLLLQKVLKSHKHPVTALCIPPDLKQLLSGDASGQLLSWSLKDDSFKGS